MLWKPSGSVFNLDLLKNSWRKEAGRLAAVRRVGGDVPAERERCSQIPRGKRKVNEFRGIATGYLWLEHRSKAMVLRKSPLIFTFQVCVFIINPLFLKGKGFLYFVLFQGLLSVLVFLSSSFI